MIKFGSIQSHDICRRKLNSSEIKRFAFERLESIFGKKENAGYQHFLPFPKCFQKVLFFEVVKTLHCVIEGLEKLSNSRIY